MTVSSFAIEETVQNTVQGCTRRKAQPIDPFETDGYDDPNSIPPPSRRDDDENYDTTNPSDDDSLQYKNKRPINNTQRTPQYQQ